jgi:hypothetical protein
MQSPTTKKKIESLSKFWKLLMIEQKKLQNQKTKS